MTELQVRKKTLNATRLVEVQTDPPGPDQMQVKVHSFAFTANNITYGVAGDQLRYWQFFPPKGDDSDHWGIIPVWGFADVVASNVDEIPVGDRLFGYFPPANLLNMTPTHIKAGQFVDGVAHRASLPPGYNMYRRVNAEPGYSAAMDNVRMLLWPLHITSFCLWDSLQHHSWYDAKQIVVMSASSKTSIGLAYALKNDATAPKTIGLTSRRNQAQVEKLGLYDQTAVYDDLTTIDTSTPTVIVDMSGNRPLLAQLHSALGEQLQHCINVGITHWDKTTQSTDQKINKARSEFFFAPDHIQMRLKDWGPTGFAEKTSAFIQSTASHSLEWLKIKEISGLKGLQEVFDDVAQGRIPPDEGLIVKL